MRRKQLDELLSGTRIPRLRLGYIREVREAVEMSGYQLADRMGISQSSLRDLEESERNGTITLRSLERAAQAMGCTLQYAFVPETSFDEFVAQQAKQKAAELTGRVARSMGLEKHVARESENIEMIAELAEEILRKGGRELWSK